MAAVESVFDRAASPAHGPLRCFVADAVGARREAECSPHSSGHAAAVSQVFESWRHICSGRREIFIRDGLVGSQLDERWAADRIHELT